ncbi:hypothetical protein SISNIDRAFT_521649 [Sistotremastrum niveocremeum HHB9708]|uniref:RFX-type winged-helix domain-containing protein n=1 Tax=Sistotremastrum niveocremeum HHB9708 TaxID=1314777 RepID=A0A164Z689_9AGAM|nr:hypothetical protein SISNIDRAFT_521649 [Sistotremastrum niveocremeum HHB9708]
MTAVNSAIHPAYMPHSRSASVSSNSSHSSSRPPSAASGVHPGDVGLPHATVPSMSHQDEMYRSYPVGHGYPIDQSHTRHSSNASQSTSYSGTSMAMAKSRGGTGKPHLPRNTHMRARAAASPYARGDNDSVHSSSSETEDLISFLAQGGQEYNGMYSHMPAHIPSQHPSNGHQHSHLSPQAVGQFERMTIGSDRALEQLAANVRSATTTSSSDRAKQIFVQAWLSANYAPYPDGNVPRQGLYFSYRRVCDQYGIPHINTATLGKAIRLCFPTIKTRRLGVRGNSKYHYCGIRPATASEAEWLQDYIRRTNNLNGQQQNAANRGTSQEHHSAQEDDDGEDEDSEDNHPKRNSLALANGLGDLSRNKSPELSYDMDISDKTPTTNTLMSTAQQAAAVAAANQRSGFASIRRHAPGESGTLAPHSSSPLQNGAPQTYLSAHTPVDVRQLPNFPNVEEAVGSSTSQHGAIAREVWGWFEEHLNALLESVRTFRFDQYEIHLRTFWASLTGEHREVVHAPAMAGLMARADAIVYDEILETLRSQMLSPIPPPALTSLRQLADKMEKILLAALEGYGNTFVEPKVELGARFGHLVLRFLDIFQVTQALSTVLTNPKQLSDMRRSWLAIDFESVRNQSALVCNCRHEDLVQLLEVDFVALLDNLPKSNEPVREVMAWADECCERLMGANRSAGGEDKTQMSSRSVLIRWGYVTSQIMRDLTIRSDPAFGAFQIMKLFLDDWIALNVLRSVALSTNSVAASVEPVMQQQYFSLSPMAGQESFSNGLEARSNANLLPGGPITPITSSMIAALTEGYPSNSLDPGGDQFAGFDPVQPSGFDVGSFTHELNISSGTPPEESASPVKDGGEPVKDENA